MKDVFTVTSSALPETTRVAGFRGAEGVSRLYEFDLYLLMGDEGQDFDLADAIGAKAKLELSRADHRHPYTFHGILSSFELVLDVNGRSLFHATLVPQLWQLSQTMHSRIFTSLSIPDILKEVLEDGGLTSDDYAFKLAGQYKPEEHVCQYQESHLDFISRWMEREGMYYYFEQGDEGEKLIISDAKSFQHELDEAKVRFYALSGRDVTTSESLSTFTCKHKELPGSVKLNDYDYTKPTLDVSGSAAVSSIGLGEINVHGARFFTPDEGKRLAKLRAEALLARQIVFHGSGTAPYLRSGYVFELEDHPRASFDVKYFVTDLEHYGNQAISTPEMKQLTGLESDDTYRVDVMAIPATVQFRPLSRTAWPRIYGFENGTICGGAESDYAQIDDHGRYNVKFKFDESDLKNGKASTWVRMLQPHGGGVEGWHFPLRKGTEVLFTFLGGDPDRPVIAGVVPNAHTPSPVTRGNHTTNVIQTGGRNRLELEDKAGSQRVTLQTPHTNTMIRMGAPNDNHNLIMTTDGHGLLHTGGSFDATIDDFKHEIVGAAVTEEYVGPFCTTVTHDVEETYEADKTEEVSGHVEETFGSQTTTVEEDCIEEVGGTLETTVAGTVTQEYGAHHEITVKAGGREDTITGKLEQTVTGEIEVHATGNIEIKSDVNIGMSCVEYEVKASGEWKRSCLGDHVEFSASVKSETIVGIKNENIIGGEIASCVGLKMEMVAAAQIEGAVGPHLFESPMVAMEGLMLELKFALIDCGSATLMIEAGAVVIV